MILQFKFAVASSERTSHNERLFHACLEQLSFGLDFMAKLDPLLKDDELAFIFNPDGNIAAWAACASECLLAAAGFLRTLAMNADELRPFPRQLSYQYL